jgi:hypothetical protein
MLLREHHVGIRHSRDTVVRFHARSNGEEGVMGILMINCPSTGRAVSTGIEMSGVDQLPNVIAQTECSACGRVHEWTKDDAWLAEGGEQYRSIAAGRIAAKSVNGHPKGAF